jgi:hypothetical protein
MTDVFKSYTSTVRKLLQRYDKDLSNAFVDKNIEEIWQDHNTWDGGIDSYLIKVHLPIEVYSRLYDSNRIKEAENRIATFYEDILKGYKSIQLNGVAISPSDNSQIDFGYNSNDTMWKPGYFRLFISHLSKNKENASGLKQMLAQYGIDCFVAHEDIKPSKAWETEIESALFSMDALCAIVVPEFNKSIWCDQEVGIAIGQHKMVFSISKGAMPYGFFGKFQALKSTNKTYREMAYDVWWAIAHNERTNDIYSEKFISLLLNAKTREEALSLLKQLQAFDSIEKKYIEVFHSHCSENNILMEAECLNIENELFSIFNLPHKGATASIANTATLHDDLPF